MEVVLDVHARDVRIKKTYQSRCCNDASSIKKKFMEKYICWYAYGEPYVLHDVIV